MNSLLMDVRYAVRMLHKSPAFTAVVALSLGLGIGVNTTIFSFVNAVLFRPPAVEKPGQLVEVWQHVSTGEGFFSYLPLTFPDFDYYRAHSHVFSGMSGFESEFGSVSWNHSEQSENLSGQLISGNYFSVLVANRCQHAYCFHLDCNFPRGLRLLILLWLRLLSAQTSGGHQKQKGNSNGNLSHRNSLWFPENSRISSRFFNEISGENRLVSPRFRRYFASRTRGM